ncbi:MAG: immunoglobulin domain-containing protein [Planctomycetota bacterium]|nr:immunoglobulin domain-containing protein [Planctomycetota bacterium]
MMAYDAAQARVTLYGGAQGFFPNYLEYADTRWLDGSQWQEVPVAFAAPARWEQAMCYDSRRGVIVLNGGGSFVGIPGNPNNHHIGGTYEFNGSTWALRTMGGPSSRHGTMMAFDTLRNRTVLFGGKHDVTGTWEWDGQTWTQVTPTGASPQLRGFAGFAFDESRGKAVLFGGGTDTFVPLGDTWEWDGATWTRVATTGPTARLGPGMVYDSFRRRIVMHGGQDNVLGRRNDLWEWDGTSWTQRTISGTPPLARYQFGFAYDKHRNRFIAAGGQDLGAGQSDTWELRGDPYVQTPPVSQVVSADSPVTLTASIASAVPMNLRWLRDGVDLADAGRVSGSASNALTIQAVSAADAGRYELRISTACGSFTTAAAVLDVSCPADFNEDGGVDGADVDFFFVAWANGETRADTNFDGGVDGSDVDRFFARWESGC